MTTLRVSFCDYLHEVWQLTGRVSEGLGLHDSLHVGRPAELAGDKDTRGVGDSVRDNNLLDLVAEVLLDGGAKTLKLLNVPAGQLALRKATRLTHFSRASFSSGVSSSSSPSLDTQTSFLPSNSLS